MALERIYDVVVIGSGPDSFISIDKDWTICSPG
jgi:hypothetical protein